MLIAASLAYALYALNDPGAAVESGLPAAYVALMVTLLAAGIRRGRPHRRH